MNHLHAALADVMSADVASDEGSSGEVTVDPGHDAAATGRAGQAIAEADAASADRYPLPVRLRIIVLLAVLLWAVIWMAARGLLHALGPR